jgi:hypothetical protein
MAKKAIHASTETSTAEKSRRANRDVRPITPHSAPAMPSEYADMLKPDLIATKGTE